MENGDGGGNGDGDGDGDGPGDGDRRVAIAGGPSAVVVGLVARGSWSWSVIRRSSLGPRFDSRSLDALKQVNGYMTRPG